MWFLELIYFGGWLAETACFVILLIVLYKGLQELRRHNQAKESILAEIRDRLPAKFSSNSN